MGLTAVPLVLALGIGVDLSRVALAKAALQHAADNAALAGATAYQSDQSAGAAQNVANSYFDHFAQGLDAVVTSRAGSAAHGQVPAGGASYNMTFDAVATMPTTFMALANVSSMTVSAHAVAANVAANTSAGGISQPKVRAAKAGSSALDWNSVYMYAVPNGSNGKPDFTQFSPYTQFYEAASNCGNTTDGYGNVENSNWSSQSRCNGNPGAVVPSTQNFPRVAATQPLAFLFVNMNNGQAKVGDQGYGLNQYGAQPGNIELLTSATMALNQSPSQNTDNSTAEVLQLFNLTLSNQSSTTYSALNGTAKPNCALQIQQVDPNNIPTNAPYPGMCFSTSDPRSGSQYANLSCSQMAGRTFMYWWNDMGGPKDDHDYNDLYFTVHCEPGSTDPNGGDLYPANPSSSTSPTSSVFLIQ